MANFYPKFVKTLFIPLLLLIGSVYLSAQNKYWMLQAGGGSPDEALGVSLDDSNNIYTTGYFTGSAKFGSIVLSTLSVSDIFVAKTNPNPSSSSEYAWVVKAGDGGDDKGLAIKTDANGNSYITGYYFGTAKFGSFSIASAGLQDVFIAKYDRNGNCKWVVSGGGSESDIGNAITLDNSGNVLITGQFTGTATFGTYTLTSTNNNINIFTAKLDSSNGNFLWVKSGTGPHTDRGLGVACDPSGNVYITGQFTDTVTFDNIQYTSLYNAIFLVKYDNAGNEQWFTSAGGAIFNNASGITVDNNSDIYLTGNFTGTLFFFGHTIKTLTNVYANKVFIAKYDAGANLLWDIADGSSNPLAVNSISLDGSGNPYIIGNFKCVLNGYADQYGQGTFNTVGYWDIFASEYNGNSGAWQWSRQVGGHGNNYGNGIAVSPTSQVYTVGSFDQDMLLPWDTSYTGYTTNYFTGCGNWDYHCSDEYYSYFKYFKTAGDLDIFIAKPFDLTKQTYDYYIRLDSSCNRPYKGVCISKYTPCDIYNRIENVCPDTLQFCSSAELFAFSYTNDQIHPHYGPDFKFLWSTGSTNQYIATSVNGWYSVTMKSVDGCFESTDSVYALIHPIPPAPTISDNVIINTNSTNPRPIHICKDSVTLTGGNYAGDKYYWTGGQSNIATSSSSISLSASDSTLCCFYVRDTFGCTNYTCVKVILDSLLPPIAPVTVYYNCRHDTAFLCDSGYFSFQVFDTISNPNKYWFNCIPPSFSTELNWSVRPNTITYFRQTNCSYRDMNQFTPTASGWYHITDSIKRKNTCTSDLHVLKDSIYVKLSHGFRVHITGQTPICPGDLTWLVASGSDTTYHWSTGSTHDSILVGAGSYFVHSREVRSTGCTTSEDASFQVKTFPETKISMSPTNGLICPGDSVKLSTSSTDGSFTWEGPSGPFGGNTDFVYVKTPGYYSCLQTDTNHCLLVSNTVQVQQYGTPFLLVTPDATICPGDSAAITVISSEGALIQWQPPFSGSDSVQYATSPGVYKCKVTSCGITTVASATVTFSDPVATITASPGTTICHLGDTTFLTANNAGVTQWIWLPGNILSQKDTVTGIGTYTLITTDYYGCTATGTVTISIPEPLRDSIASQINVSCNGYGNGSLTLGLTGGSPTYNYLWSNGATTSSISGLSIGTYSVSVNDRCGYTATTIATITQPPILHDSVAAYINLNCNGNNTGSINLGVSGGSPSYTYTWSNSASTSAISGLSAGTYTVSVTDKNGCAATASATLTQPLALAYSNIANTNENCNAGNTANASVAVSGGTPTYTYLWNPGGQSTPTVSNLSAGSYSVIVTDSAGCSLTTSVAITQPAAISTTISSDSANCINNNGSITISAGGGTSPYSYSWSPGGNTNFSISSLSAGKYTVTITDANGCIDTASGIVGINKTFTMTVTGTDSICKGQSVTLSATGAATYKWSNSNTSSSITVSPTANTTYWVIGSLGVCNDSIPYAVSVYKNLESNMPLNDTICAGKPVILKVNVAGGKPAYTYVWNNGITNDNAGPIAVYPTTTTTYSVTVTDACNYLTTDTMHVVVIPSGKASFYVSPDTIQPGQVVTFTNTGTGNTSYYWTFGDGSSTTGTSPSHDYTNSGTYQITLIGYNSYGCPDTVTQDVFVSPIVIIPNVFTPNGDGQNDVFYFDIAGATCLHCNIYNRWGVLVYQLNSMAEGWPGIIRQTNELASDGVYYYILDYCDYKGLTHKQDGFIQLIRNK